MKYLKLKTDLADTYINIEHIIYICDQLESGGCWIQMTNNESFTDKRKAKELYEMIS